MSAALIAAAVAGCGGSSDKSDDPLPDLGVSPSLASCRDWRAGRRPQREGTVREIRRFAGGPSSGEVRGATLSDSHAYRLFQNYCANRFARDFKLYKLYTRAAAFGAR